MNTNKKAVKVNQQSGNFLQKIIRTVVKEEFVAVENRIKSEIPIEVAIIFERMNDKLVKEVREMRNEILTSNDQIAGEIKTMREEQQILSSGHHRLVALEEDVENLQKIHPHGQHASV